MCCHNANSVTGMKNAFVGSPHRADHLNFEEFE